MHPGDVFEESFEEGVVLVELDGGVKEIETLLEGVAVVASDGLVGGRDGQVGGTQHPLDPVLLKLVLDQDVTLDHLEEGLDDLVAAPGDALDQHNSHLL